jgi:hypothetical protein
MPCLVLDGRFMNVESVCLKQQAERETQQIRNVGKATYYWSLKITCERVACQADHALIHAHEVPTWNASCRHKNSSSLHTTEFLVRFKMTESVLRLAPISPGLSMTKEGEALGSEVPFGSPVGALMYLASCTRPDIAYLVGQLSRYKAAPMVEHWTIAKGVLRYLKGSASQGLLFGCDKIVCGCAGANFSGCVDARRCGFVFVMHGGAVAWGSRIQPIVATSTCEAEYMSAGTTIREASWLRKLLVDLGYPRPRMGNMEIKGDNQAALRLLENPLNLARGKHIDVVNHFARERVERGALFFSFCPIQKNVADGVPKALGKVLFGACAARMGCV